MKLIQKIEELCSNVNFVVIIAALISAITAVGLLSIIINIKRMNHLVRL